MGAGLAVFYMALFGVAAVALIVVLGKFCYDRIVDWRDLRRPAVAPSQWRQPELSGPPRSVTRYWPPELITKMLDAQKGPHWRLCNELRCPRRRFGVFVELASYRDLALCDSDWHLLRFPSAACPKCHADPGEKCDAGLHS